MIPRRSSTAAAVSGVPREPSRRAAAAGEAASRASATRTVRLPSTRSSPAGLPVVAGSPKTPSRSSRSWKASPSGSPKRVSCHLRRRRAGQGGADVERPLDGVLRGLVAQHRHRGVDVGAARGPAPTRRGTARRSPRGGSGRRARAPGATCVGGSPQRRSSSSDQPSSRSPSRIAAAAPYCSGSPRQPAPRCSASNARWVAGRPRRVSEASMKSSWTRALACSSSREAQARDQRGLVGDVGRHRAVAPVAERRPEPLAAGAPTCAPRRPAGRRRRRAAPARGPLVEERIQHLLDLVAEGRRGPRSSRRRD